MSHETDDPHDSPESARNQSELAAAVREAGPWTISLLVHAAIVALAVALVWTTIRQPREPDNVPDVVLHKRPAQALSTEHSRAEPVKRSRDARVVVSEVDPDPMQLRRPLDLIALRVTPAGSDNPFSRALQSHGIGEDSVDGWGVRGNARRIVYVIDASGSLIDTFAFVIEELQQSVQKLGPRQQFTVMFFQNGEVIESPPLGLVNATPQAKRRLIQWLAPQAGNIVPHGRGNPVEAVRRALRYQPDLVFLLSDNITGRGVYELHQDRLLHEVRLANTHRVHFNTIQFVHPDPLERIGRAATMKCIADETGGQYKFVSAAELGVR